MSARKRFPHHHNRCPLIKPSKTTCYAPFVGKFHSPKWHEGEFKIAVQSGCQKSKGIKITKCSADSSGVKRTQKSSEQCSNGGRDKKRGPENKIKLQKSKRGGEEAMRLTEIIL